MVDAKSRIGFRRRAKPSWRGRLRTWALADAEYGDLWREGQILLHSPALHGSDNLAVKLRIIEVMRQIADSRNNLAFGVERQKAAEQNPTAVAKRERPCATSSTSYRRN